MLYKDFASRILNCVLGNHDFNLEKLLHKRIYLFEILPLTTNQHTSCFYISTGKCDFIIFLCNALYFYGCNEIFDELFWIRIEFHNPDALLQ